MMMIRIRGGARRKKSRGVKLKEIFLKN